MKELSVEEKAKRYDEALKVLHKYDGANIMFSQSLKEEMFPELAESEDERINRKLVEYFLHYPDHEITYYGLKTDSVIAWLKKQSEQSKKYDVCDNCDQQGSCVSPCPMKLIEKQGEQKPDDKVEPKFKVGDTITDPTDSAFTFHTNAIKDGKYMEADEDWMLIKGADSDYELVEQKPAWSEEDINKIDTIIGYIASSAGEKLGDLLPCINWLESLKDRVQPQQEWSEEDETIAKALTKAANDNVLYGYIDKSKLLEWLKSPKDRYTWKPSDEQMEALEYYMHTLVCNEHKEILFGLYTDLKKLREELL